MHNVDPQDMFNMGGLRKKMPITFWTFLIGGLALSGFPLVTAGFWSKDEILADAFGTATLIVFVTLALAAFLTAFYTMRQITLTFLGEPRTQAAEHAHEIDLDDDCCRWSSWRSLPSPPAGSASPNISRSSAACIPNWFHEFVGGTLLEHPAGAGVQLDRRC